MNTTEEQRSGDTAQNQKPDSEGQEDKQETTKLSPSVYWAQTKNHITLKIDLKDAKVTQSLLSPKNLIFAAKGRGACGVNNYKFELHFYGFVMDEYCFYSVSDNSIKFNIEKSVKGWWPRLVATPQKPHWLKIDFERWLTEDDMLEEEQKKRNIMYDYPKEYAKLQKQEIGYIRESYKKGYLIFYNLAQFVGYFYIVSVMCLMYYRDGADFMPKTYEYVGPAMKFCQLLQYLEVLHPIFGYTKGGALIPFFQVSGRNFILFFMIEMEERMQTKPVVFYVFLIWASVELFRYPYYVTQLLGREVGLITWLRYSVWIPLYPMGILCEGIIIIRNIPYFEETKRFCLEMPNKLNVTFDMPTFLKVYLLLLILPGTYMVITHMARTRAKKLNYSDKQRPRRHFD